MDISINVLLILVFSVVPSKNLPSRPFITVYATVCYQFFVPSAYFNFFLVKCKWVILHGEQNISSVVGKLMQMLSDNRQIALIYLVEQFVWSSNTI